MKSDTWSRHNASVHLCMCLCIIKPSGFRSLFVVFNIIKPVLFTTSSIDIFFPRMQPSHFYVFIAIKVSQSSLREGKMTLKKKTALLLIFLYNFSEFLIIEHSLTHAVHSCTYAMIFTIFFRNSQEGKRESQSMLWLLILSDS